MAILNWTQYAGGFKDWDSEMGSFQFSGTDLTAELPTKLRRILKADFNAVNGTVQLGSAVSGFEYLLRVDAIGTVNSTTGHYGAISVSGTSVTIDRHQLPSSVGVTAGTAIVVNGTVIQNQTIQYVLWGYR